MMRKPLISIITVVLNGADTLERAIVSVLNQSFGNIEYVIVDGGSLDGSIDIIRKYEANLTHWSSQKDNGVYDAMNKALSNTSGKWIYFLGADDQLLDVLETVAGYLKDEKTIYYGNVYRPKMGRVYDGKFSAYKLACRNICQQAIFYPRWVWDNYSFNLKYPIFADYEFNLRCYADTNLQFEYMPLTITVFEDAGGLSPTQRDEAFERDKLRLIRELYPHWIYFLMVLRSLAMKLIKCLKLQKILKKVYHHILGLRFKWPMLQRCFDDRHTRKK